METSTTKYYECEVCRGALHEWSECPTKKKLDKFARDNDDVANWGDWKFKNYYHKVKAEREAKQEQARKDENELYEDSLPSHK